MLLTRHQVRSAELIKGVDGYAIEIALVHRGQLERHTVCRQSPTNTPWKMHQAVIRIRQSYGLEESP